MVRRQDAIEYMCRNAVPAVIELEHFGVPFSRTPEGTIYQRPFGGHTVRHGQAMQNGLVQQRIERACYPPYSLSAMLEAPGGIFY